MPQKPHEAAAIEFGRAVGLLVRRVRAAADEVSMAEAAGLNRRAGGGPATTAGLARAEGMRPQSMGAVVALLVKRGLVARRPHPTDGRRVNVGLTARGAAVRRGT